MDGNWYLYMVNDVAPKGAELGPNSMASSLVAKAKENLLSSLLVDQPMAFQITANLPSAEASDTHGKLDTQVIVAQQRQCLLKLQTKYGFQILKQVSVSSAKDENDYVYELINQDQPIFGHLQNGHIRTDCVTFAGDLVIKNLLSFEKMLLNGMEGGKDADFGLLTLTPTM